MNIKDASITILINMEYTDIELYDKTSGCTLARVTLTPEQLSKALGRLGHTPCKMEVFNFDKANKNQLIDHVEFPFDDKGINYDKRQKEAVKQSKKYIPEGWEGDEYFGSQGSFFTKDGQAMAKFTIRKWE